MLKLFTFLFFALKGGKILATVGTMLLSIVAYSLFFGWRYAVGIVLLIFVHEMGHYLAARQRGLAVGAPTFIPFVGAWVQLKDLPHDAETEAYVGLAGPLFGTMAALACYGWGLQQGDRLWLALAYAGFFLNLFNLIPLSPFDGGRITAVLSPRIWFLGVPILLALFYYHPSPLLLVMAVLALPQLLQAWRYDPNAPEVAAYYTVSRAHRIAYTIAYLALAAFLAMMAHDVQALIGPTSTGHAGSVDG